MGSKMAVRWGSLVWASVLVVMLCGLAVLVPGAPQVEAAAPIAQADTDWGKMPLYFIENQGQLDETVGYYVQGTDKTLYFSTDNLTFALTSPAKKEETGQANEEATPAGAVERWTVKLDYLGAREVNPEGKDKTEAVISYFRGDQEDWQAGLPTYSSILYPDLWKGIDLLYSGTQDQLKQEFLLAPGADPAQINLAFRGANLKLNDRGELEVTTPVAGFTDAAPVAWQQVGGRRVNVPVEFVLGSPSGSGAQEITSYSFSLGSYDSGLPLVIDPAVLVYCGYIGGSSCEVGEGSGNVDIAVDKSGCAYVAGETRSSQVSFPEKVGPDLTFNGGDFTRNGDAFIAKVKADGTGLVYCGYIGGSSWDSACGVAVDSSGCAYITGETRSAQGSFPEKLGPDLTFNGSSDAFVAKVNAGGTALVYCGYIGGADYESGNDIAVDSKGNAYVTGQTASSQSSFPEKVGPGLTRKGYDDAFVAKVNAAGTGLVYCGYIGGNNWDYGKGIAVDGAGNAYVTGQTYLETYASPSAGFPVKVGPDLYPNGGWDAFVAKVKPDGSGLVYCGYIGGSGSDGAQAVAVDSSGNAYVTGATSSDEYGLPVSFPVRVGPSPYYNYGGDAFVAKVNAAGTGLVYCGYIGGLEYDTGTGIAVDSRGNAYVVGTTDSTEDYEYGFPSNGGPDPTYNGWQDAFVAKVNSAGSALVYCGYVGGSDTDYGEGIAVDSSGSAYVAGHTYSAQSSFPVRVGPDLTFNGADQYGGDAFVAKVCFGVPPVVTRLTPKSGPTTGGTGMVIAGTGFDSVSKVTVGGVGVTFTRKSSTQITANVPAHAAGVVDVRVTTSLGTSSNTTADNYTYITPARHQESSAKLGYAGTWSSVTNPSTSGGTYKAANSAGSTVIVSFKGSYLSWIATKGPAMGKARVSLDYGPPMEVDLYASSTAWRQKVWQTPYSLVSGVHTLVIEWTGKKNAASTKATVNVDAFDMLGTIYQGPIRYQQNNAKLIYSSGWSTASSASASAGSLKYTGTTNAKITVKFNGPYIAWVGVKSRYYGKARVTLDGVYKGTVDLYSASEKTEQNLWSGRASYGSHTLVITCTGTKNAAAGAAYINADAFDVIGRLY